LFPTLILLTQCFFLAPPQERNDTNMQSCVFGFKILQNLLGNFQLLRVTFSPFAADVWSYLRDPGHGTP